MVKPILLIGMMGCGKSTLGRMLAKRLGRAFIDLDGEIERREGRSIPDIFAAEGDAGFRRYETAALLDALCADNAVIATGGGIVTREENIAAMRGKGLVVWLCRPLEEIIADVRQDTRPNLAGNKEERMRTLYAQRGGAVSKSRAYALLQQCAAEKSAEDAGRRNSKNIWGRLKHGQGVMACQSGRDAEGGAMSQRLPRFGEKR